MFKSVQKLGVLQILKLLGGRRRPTERGLPAGVVMQTTRGEDDGTRNSAVVAGCANPGDHFALAVLRSLRWPHAPPKSTTPSSVEMDR